MPLRIYQKSFLKKITSNTGEDVGKLSNSYIAGGDVKQYSHSAKTVQLLPKKLKMQLPQDPAMALLGILSKKMFTQKSTHKCLQQLYP